MTTTYGRLILPLTEPALTAGGLVSGAGATLTVFSTGTTNLATIYADGAGATPIANPQTSNSAGRFYVQSTEIWADSSVAYDAVLALPNGENFTWRTLWLLGQPPTVSGYAPLNSPAFTGVPTAPTAAANDASSQIATDAFVAAAIAAINVFPTGMLGTFAMSSLPSGWLLCNGAAVSRTTYAALFGSLGTTYGAGDGTTTFNLPNYQGYFLRGLNTTMSGIDQGRALGSVQTDEMQGHYHGPLSPTSQIFGGTTGIYGVNGGVSFQDVASTGAPITDGSNGTPRTGTETRPSNIAVVIAIHI